MSEDNVKLQLRQPWMKIGTDAGGPDPDSVRALVHPRTFGNYPRILGLYVRDEKVIPLEDAIRKMTSAVATRLSIHDRGLLEPGMYADVVVFDPATIADRATYEQPKQLSVGVRDVWVNGVAGAARREAHRRDARPRAARPGLPAQRASGAPSPPCVRSSTRCSRWPVVPHGIRSELSSAHVLPKRRERHLRRACHPCRRP